jgi:hypothetical protein
MCETVLNLNLNSNLNQSLSLTQSLQSLSLSRTQTETLASPRRGALRVSVSLVYILWSGVRP